MSQFRLVINGDEQLFLVTRQDDRLHIEAGEAEPGKLTAEARILHRDGQRLLIEIRHGDGEAQRVQLVGVRNGSKRRLWIDGRVLPVERIRGRSSRAVVESGSLSASIPAVVSQVLVKIGDVVTAGDKLILLESMKMVIPIQSPHDGRVARILCEPGESVPAGVPLVEIESL